ncbi:pilus assembly protein [Massilia sp. Dwa41.01b]|uniref:TadE/TadG family type IV pilus assembly protein n=1 Tax=Massilia sp. Dwa41.01b TaxID=2709302 RepID=UPI001601D9F8|nr:TadE/TadG family type IV pilus assembly protein [Massilia sp. Dwa41.01b]QNA88726.1 pilus assembly protein [Massilia sp. Dwa41.01b]
MLHSSLGSAEVVQAVPVTARASAQRGSAMIEFVIVGPILTLIGLAVLQYSMLFFAKNQLNHAAFMAARAGSLGNASITKVKTAYIKALVPVYGGGTNAAELAESLGKATADVAAFSKVELINPTKESFMDWGNNPALMAKYQTNGKRVIPNSGLAFKDHNVGGNSGQTVQDANLIKLRIMHGYEMKIPIVKTVFKAWLKARDPHTDALYTAMVAQDRIPVVSNVTLHMQSDAIEGDPISAPGAGNGGTPTNPGDPPEGTDPPPNCSGIGCNPPPEPVDPGTPCTGADCPVCPAG